jgi:hypothetical protein
MVSPAGFEYRRSQLQAAKAGFRTIARGGATLAVGSQPVVDFSLPPGQAQQAMVERDGPNTHLLRFWLDSRYVIDSILAVRVGFEPTEPLKNRNLFIPRTRKTRKTHPIIVSLRIYCEFPRWDALTKQYNRPREADC